MQMIVYVIELFLTYECLDLLKLPSVSLVVSNIVSCLLWSLSCSRRCDWWLI